MTGLVVGAGDDGGVGWRGAGGWDTVQDVVWQVLGLACQLLNIFTCVQDYHSYQGVLLLDPQCFVDHRVQLLQLQGYHVHGHNVVSSVPFPLPTLHTFIVPASLHSRVHPLLPVVTGQGLLVCQVEEQVVIPVRKIQPGRFNHLWLTFQPSWAKVQLVSMFPDVVCPVDWVRAWPCGAGHPIHEHWGRDQRGYIQDAMVEGEGWLLQADGCYVIFLSIG